MAWERVLVLKCDDPRSLVLLNTKTKIEVTCGIFNCDPIENNVWSEKACVLLRHWLMKAVDVWLVPMDEESGLVFFRDPEDRIVNAKQMLVELKMAKNRSFVFQKKETTMIGKLKTIWTELHDLNIDYSFFTELNVSPKRMKSVPESLPEPVAKKPKEFDPFEEEMMAMEALVPITPESNPEDSKLDPIKLESSLKYYPGKYPIFVYAKDHPEPYTSMQQVPLLKSIKDTANVADPSFHFHIWANSLNDGSSIFIEPTQQLKICFIVEPIIFNYVYGRISDRRNNTGPLAVCIVDTRQSAESLGSYFGLFNDKHTIQVRVGVVVDGYGANQDELMAKMKCDILILTLSMMTDLMYRWADGLRLHEAKKFVFLNVHNMNERNFLEVIRHFRVHKKENQVMVTSKHWLTSLDKLYAQLSKPAVVFGSPIELAFMTNTKMELKINQNQAQQLNTLIEILQDSLSKNCRAAVVCKNAEAVEVVSQGLLGHDIPFYKVGDTPRAANILLMTDTHIKDMIIDPVDYLIHFSIPRWRIFSNRFVLFEQHFINKASPRTFVLLTLEESKTFLPEMENMCSRRSLKGMGQLASLFRSIKDELEDPNELFCENLALYGVCKTQLSCQHRHKLSKADVPNWRLHSFVNGQVHLKFKSVVTPNHLLAEVIPPEHLRDQWQLDLLKLKFNLDTHMEQEVNRVKKPICAVGDLCVFREGQFQRAKVLSKSRSCGFDLYEVQCLETGKKFRLRSTEIYELPDQFREMCPQVLDVYLLGPVPREMESDWSPRSTQHLNIQLKQYNFKDNKFILQGRVVCVLGSRMYLKMPKVVERLEIALSVCSLDFTEWLCDYMYAESKDNGLALLERITEQFDLGSMVVVPEEYLAQSKPAIDAREILPIRMEEPEPLMSANVKESVAMEDAADTSDLSLTEPGPMEDEQPDEEQEENWNDDCAEPFEYKSQAEMEAYFKDFDFDFADEDLAELFPGLSIRPPAIAAPPPPQSSPYGCATIEEIPVEDEEEMGDFKADPVPMPKGDMVPLLVPMVKMPQIRWSQTDDEIKLRIAATDVVDYQIEVVCEYIVIGLQFADEQRGGLVPFFGLINTGEEIRVELRGLMIVVTMQKVLKGAEFKWPRLLKYTESEYWLQYYQSFDDVDKDSADDAKFEVLPIEGNGADEDEKVDLSDLS